MTPEDLRLLLKELPAVTEDVKWETNLCFLVGGKIFALASLDQPTRVAFKVSDEDFALLTGREDIIQAPHFARNQWVQVLKAGALTRREWQDYLAASYGLIVEKLPKKIRKELDV